MAGATILVLADPQPVDPDGIQLWSTALYLVPDEQGWSVEAIGRDPIPFASLRLACDHVIAELEQRIPSAR